MFTQEETLGHTENTLDRLHFLDWERLEFLPSDLMKVTMERRL